MSRRRILVIGNSHTRALARGLNQLELDPSIEIRVGWLQSEKRGQVLGDMPLAEAEALIDQLAPEDILALSFLGTLHMVYGLLQHEVPFSVVSDSDGAEEVQTGCQLIPRRAIEAWFQAHSQANKVVKRLLVRSRARNLHLMTPPPIGENEYIASVAEKYRDKLVTVAGINPPMLRKSLWEIERDVMSRVLGEAGASLLMPPDAALEDGFLRPEFRVGDATHANADYGRLVLRQLIDLARGNGARAIDKEG